MNQESRKLEGRLVPVRIPPPVSPTLLSAGRLGGGRRNRTTRYVQADPEDRPSSAFTPPQQSRPLLCFALNLLLNCFQQHLPLTSILHAIKE